MIKEAYVSFEVARLLKEKGFNGLCGACFDPNDKSLNTIYYDTSGGVEPQDWNNLNEREAGKIGLATWYGYISAPTQQMAMAYLRRVHHIIIVIQPLSFNVSKDFLCENWVYSVWAGDNLEIDESLKNQSAYSSYEKAVNAALKYCLKNLI